MSGKKHILEGDGTRCDYGYREAPEWQPGDALESLCCNCAKSYFLRKSAPKNPNPGVAARRKPTPPASAPKLTNKDIQQRADRTAGAVADRGVGRMIRVCIYYKRHGNPLADVAQAVDLALDAAYDAANPEGEAAKRISA